MEEVLALLQAQAAHLHSLATQALVVPVAIKPLLLPTPLPNNAVAQDLLPGPMAAHHLQMLEARHRLVHRGPVSILVAVHLQDLLAQVMVQGPAHKCHSTLVAHPLQDPVDTIHADLLLGSEARHRRDHQEDTTREGRPHLALQDQVTIHVGARRPDKWVDRHRRIISEKVLPQAAHLRTGREGSKDAVRWALNLNGRRERRWKSA